MKAQAIPTGVATLVSAAGNRDFLHILNNSDTIMYARYDGSNVTLDTTTGFPIAVGATLVLSNDGPRLVYNKAVYVYHEGGADKEIRVQGED